MNDLGTAIAAYREQISWPQENQTRHKPRDQLQRSIGYRPPHQFHSPFNSTTSNPTNCLHNLTKCQHFGKTWEAIQFYCVRACR